MQHNGFKRDTIKMHHISGPAEPVFKDSSANHLHLSIQCKIVSTKKSRCLGLQRNESVSNHF